MLTFKRHHSTLLRRFVLVSLLCVAVPVLTTAQVLYGSLTGTVTDPKEAAVPGARVEIVNSATNETRSTTTDDRGGYSFNNLQVGIYKLTITLNSFKTLVKDDVRIEANKVYRLDPRLELGEVRETVLVSSDQMMPLQTDRTDVNITQTTRQVNDTADRQPRSKLSEFDATDSRHCRRGRAELRCRQPATLDLFQR